MDGTTAMKTTIEIDERIAAELKRLSEAGNISFDEAIWEALCFGVNEMRQQRGEPKRFWTRSLNLGESKVGSLDKVWDVWSKLKAPTTNDRLRQIGQRSPNSRFNSSRNTGAISGRASA